MGNATEQKNCDGGGIVKPNTKNQTAELRDSEMKDKIIVLHVDDDEDIRVITELAFSLDPLFELVQCASGPEAIERAKYIQPDLLLLDMVMPGLSGEETWERLNADFGMAGTPTIFMSARAEKSFSNDLLQKGAIAVITKPFDPMTLCTEIKSALQNISTVRQSKYNNIVKFPT